MVSRYLQQRRRPFQVPLPVLRLPLHFLSTHPLPLPRRIICVLHLHLRQRIRFSSPERSVQHTQLFEQHSHRPSVGHDVVHGDQQRMLIFSQFHHPPAQQR